MRDHYPSLFSLASRMNPFDSNAGAIIRPTSSPLMLSAKKKELNDENLNRNRKDH
jgi:hypothetical protein